MSASRKRGWATRKREEAKAQAFAGTTAVVRTASEFQRVLAAQLKRNNAAIAALQQENAAIRICLGV